MMLYSDLDQQIEWASRKTSTTPPLQQHHNIMFYKDLKKQHINRV